MANIGCWAGELLEGAPDKKNHIPSWFNPRQAGHHCFGLMKQTFRGTLTTTPDQFMWRRIQRCADFAHQMIRTHKPDLLVTEAVLTHGIQRNVTGGMVLAAILDRYREIPDPSTNEHRPMAVITIPPPKLRSIAHGGPKHKGRKVTKAVVKKRCQEVTGTQEDRWTDHEADAFFLAYYGVRFWNTCVEQSWPQQALGRSEVKAFLTGTAKNARTKETHSTAMLDRQGDLWWECRR